MVKNTNEIDVRAPDLADPEKTISRAEALIRRPEEIVKVKQLRTFNSVKIGSQEKLFFRAPDDQILIMCLGGLFYIKIINEQAKDFVCLPLQNVAFWK